MLGVFCCGVTLKKEALHFLCRLIAITLVYCVRQSDWNTNEVFKFDWSGGRILKKVTEIQKNFAHIYTEICSTFVSFHPLDVSHLIENNFLYYFAIIFYMYIYLFYYFIYMHTFIIWFSKLFWKTLITLILLTVSINKCKIPIIASSILLTTCCFLVATLCELKFYQQL